MKNYIIGIIIGVCITITVLSVWQLLSMAKRVAVLENFAVQVTNLINSNSKQNE